MCRLGGATSIHLGERMSLLEYCNTERQRQVVELYEQGLGYTKIGEKVGCSRYAVRDSIQAVKARAAMQGWSPQHDMVHTVPNVFKIRGVSTLYNDEGKPVNQWVKSVADKDAQFQAMIERIEIACEGITPWKPIKEPKQIEQVFSVCW